MLRGRQDEREVLDRLLTAARAGCKGALVVRGEPGLLGVDAAQIRRYEADATALVAAGWGDAPSRASAS